MTTTYRSSRGSHLYGLMSTIVIAIAVAIGTALYYLFAWVNSALANPIVYNGIYVTTMFGVGACVVGQVGSWLSKKSSEDGLLNQLFWRYGPIILLALLCTLYLRADYLQSFH